MAAQKSDRRRHQQHAGHVGQRQQQAGIVNQVNPPAAVIGMFKVGREAGVEEDDRRRRRSDEQPVDEGVR